ncbi:hypothetical protein GO986_05570 [Deinococcus sp. HMF7620]|uniref:Bulb-type lectin domain-containing protein n=1 Tax=Deinococcus arboris TaxID=2682977 RepID=A0A7C9HQK1_9DEIO|nr:hypothetical protein [Deinococcus arboris]MVN86229.1 hypothetical protein [Deinococcus arboris]
MLAGACALASCSQTAELPSASVSAAAPQPTLLSAQAISNRTDIVNRAKAWVAARVPYSQTTLRDGYRQDCSGLVSMAWGLSTAGTWGGPNTATLPGYADKIGYNDLLPGDAVNNPRTGNDGHVVLFVEWKTPNEVNKPNDRVFIAYEENGGAGKAIRSELTLRKLTNGRYTIVQYGGEYDLLRSKAVTSAPPSPLPTVTHSGNGDLTAGEGLMANGDSVLSNNGQYRLAMQADGNLVLYSASGSPRIIPTGTYGKPVHRLIMQSDGNLVIYGTGNQALWATNTSGRAGAWLAIEDGGALVLWHGSQVAWRSGPGGSPTPTPPPPTHNGDDLLTSGEGLSATDDCFHSSDGRYHLCLQSDGNLALYGPSGVLWTTNTAGRGHQLRMQADGNLVLLDAGGAKIWDTGTGGHPGAALAVQVDGNLVVYHNGNVIWQR